MIFGFEESKILKIATENQSEMTDGVVQYDYMTGELLGSSFTTGSVENYENPVIEVFRLEKGERGEIDCKCWEEGDCPFRKTGTEYDISPFNPFSFFDEDMTDEFGRNRISCCIDGFLENVDIEEENRESIEKQIRDVLSDFLGDTLSKLNDIRIAISDRVAPHNYIQVRSENWEEDVIDSYVDSAMEFGFTIDCDPADFLDAEVQHLSTVRFREDDVEFWGKVGCLIEEHDFDGALEMLQ